jgi:hypothetical protein
MPLLSKDHQDFCTFSYALTNHVPLEDFNIHNPNWGSPGVLLYFASQLPLSLQGLHNILLPLPSENISYKKHGREAIIVFVFSSPNFLDTLAACCLREDLDHGSNHHIIKNLFLFSPHVSLYASQPLLIRTDIAAPL